MVKGFLYALLLTVLMGCVPPEFEKNTRILVKGNIINQDDNPISDFEINIYTEKANGFSGGRNYLLGSGLSKQDGSFSISSLFDRDEQFQIEINGKNEFSNYFYSTSTLNYTPNSLTFNLNTIILNKLSVFKYNIIRTSPSGTNFQFSFKFKNSDCFELYDEGVLNDSESHCFKEVILNRSLNNNKPDIIGRLTTLLGSTIEFKYSINDEPEITETLTIDKENYEFNFSY